jgi:hypothetical protein
VAGLLTTAINNNGPLPTYVGFTTFRLACHTSQWVLDLISAPGFVNMRICVARISHCKNTEYLHISAI